MDAKERRPSTEVEHAEQRDIVDEKPKALENADFTGAVAKTDPEEIKLVRKIDWRLMVHGLPPLN